jgi:phosphoribosyl-AMP cyclohydrolase / phosphoribosyl-ATP pyrophosphohydrolase
MIIPSIDIMNGRAVQLRHGREFVLDGGDPLTRLEEFAVAGEVAVVDLDAARGQGSNEGLIRRMVRRAPCRVGGGIRDLDTARAWLDAGAARVVIGTALSPDLCGALPRDRVIGAVDARRGEVVVDGWRTRTGVSVLQRIRELQSVVGGFLFTQVEREGEMAGCDLPAVTVAVGAAGDARVTAAGGITTPGEVAELDRIGADAQVGMALYTGRLPLGDAVAAPLTRPLEGDVWPTVVCDEAGRTLGLVWSTRASLVRAVTERRGIYWSRSRGALWVKGETSGNEQQLMRVDLDCDRDALRFTVRQRGAGFCHLDRPSCWTAGFTLDDLERAIAERVARPDPRSGTTKLLASPPLLAAKLGEEAGELARAATPDAVVAEAADVFYMALVALARGGGSLADVRAVLARRHGAVTRRPMTAKPVTAP